MPTLAPRWALSAHAIDAGGDPHLKPGGHLRITPSADLGLPVAPFLVYTVEGVTMFREDIMWIDSLGKRRVTPFVVTESNPVTGYFPPASVPCMAKIVPTPIIELAPGPEVSALAASTLRLDALVAGPRGLAVASSAGVAPDAVAHTPIDQVRVSGSGTVHRAYWLDAREVQIPTSPTSLLGLPVVSAKRYAGLTGAADLALQRVQRGAPTRRGLHDAPTAAQPSDAPAATDAQEVARLAEGQPTMAGWLQTLVNDTTVAPHDARADVPVPTRDDSGSRLRVPCLAALLQASLDPGVGRWLGYVDRDNHIGTTQRVLFYVVRGIFARPDGLSAARAAELGTPNVANVRDFVGTLGQHFDRSQMTLTGPGYDLYTVAGFVVGRGALRPSPPSFATSMPTRRPWQVSPPQTYQRVTVLRNLLPGATIALARRQGTAITGLNRRSPGGRARSLVGAVSQAEHRPGSIEWRDRNAPGVPFAYRGAQADWFGRWSTWAERDTSPPPLPAPPVPTLTATYVPAVVPSPMPLESLRGTVRVSVQVPPPSALPPGGSPLTQVIVNAGGTQVTRALPSPDTRVLPVDVPGPALARADEGTAQVYAIWRDAAGRTSAPSTPIELRVCDPRPPEAVVLPVTFGYASRPDATGHARVELTWARSTRHAGYRVFYSDEVRVRAALATMAATAGPQAAAAAAAALAALAAANGPAARAGVLVQVRELLGRGLFEQLPPVRSTAATLRVAHAVPSALRALSIYRVVALSSAEVEEPFETSALAVFAVPNTGAPPAPHLRVEAVRDASGAYRARLHVRVPRGLVPAAEYRVRRSTDRGLRPLEMLQVATGAFPAPAESDAAQELIVDDLGASIAGPGALRAWTEYHWCVDVRGAAEADGGPSAAWSEPSPLATATFVPAGPPASISMIDLRDVTGGLDLVWEHAEPLRGGYLGDYRFEVFRTPPGGREEQVATVSADAGPLSGGRGPTRTGLFTFREQPRPPEQTRYRVAVRDPAGRLGAPSMSIVVVPEGAM